MLNNLDKGEVDLKPKQKDDTPIPKLDKVSRRDSEEDRDSRPKARRPESSSDDDSLQRCSLDSGDQEVINQMLNDDDPDVARILDDKKLESSSSGSWASFGEEDYVETQDRGTRIGASSLDNESDEAPPSKSKRLI